MFYEIDKDFDLLPDEPVPEAMTLIAKVARDGPTEDRFELAATVYKALAMEHREQLPEEMERLGIGTRDELLYAVDMYLEDPEAWEVPEDDGEDESDADENAPSLERQEISQSAISDIALYVIDNVVRRTRVTDRYDVMAHVCDVMERRFGSGEKLEQNLAKMNLTTTKDVLYAIDIYFTMKRLYPDTVFGRKRMKSVWAPIFNDCLPESEVS